MSRKEWILLLLVFVSLAAVIVVLTREQTPQSFPLSPSSYELSITVGGRVRVYPLHIPRI